MTQTQTQTHPLALRPGERSTYSIVLTAKDSDSIIHVDVTFTQNDAPPEKHHTTVDHAPVTGSYLTVSFEGEVFDRDAHLPWTSGQVSDYLPDGHPLRTLWDRWHLNALRSHCIHQDPDVSWDEVDPCPETGYECGSAWLFEPLPPDVVTAITALMTTTLMTTPTKG